MEKTIIEKDMKYWFRLVLPDRVLRTMNRQQYKEAMRWLRAVRRIVHTHINNLPPEDIKWFQLTDEHSCRE